MSDIGRKLLLFFLIVTTVATLMLTGCSKSGPEMPKPSLENEIAKANQTLSRMNQVILVVKESNNSQSYPNKASDYSGAPYYYKSEWSALYLRNRYPQLGEEWDDLWMVLNYHIDRPHVTSVNTARWLYRENTGEVYYLNILVAGYHPEIKESQLKMALDEIRAGILEPNK